MKLLLDTHVFLWALEDLDRLPGSVQTLLAATENPLLVSVASFWEIAIKTAAGKLVFKDPSRLASLEEWVHLIGAEMLPISAKHALATVKLRDWLHKDPFDRMLAAQALVEDATLVTADSALWGCPGLRWTWNRTGSG